MDKHWLSDSEVAELEKEKPIGFRNNTFERKGKWYSCEFRLTRDGLDKQVYGPFNTAIEALDANPDN